MVCLDCMEPYIVKSRTPKICRDCEAKFIARAAKEPDIKALSIAELSAWLQSGQSPRRIRAAWEIK